ncbi:type III pantothenate kinase [Spirosoma taeanense]|uniref:Type III pantothenate kinase n=1 Tax=Spirosoma taeanense TaxID=2735870 RepID=A0A6M5Y9Y0_9BACT|nr:type III pantothenate kinase [Spirosoma taeanense]QJW90080.1 type III pantothenate kinase [Spirosoma taeanense]
MNLVIDWGNSSLKTGWFREDKQIVTGHYPSVDALLAELDGASPGQPAHVLVSSTSRPADEIRAGLSGLNSEIRILDAQTPVPIRKAYDTPHSLGTDRVAAAVGAASLFPDQACLVLDLGTCLTADFVDPDATFQGGLISPGLRMRFRAMHEQTARLPLVEPPTDGHGLDWPELTAKNTRSAMLSGVVNGLAFEMNGLLDAYRQKWPDLVVVLCGGDASVFESHLKPPIFAVPELVLVGLNRILRYNVENLHAHTPGTTN